VAGDDTSVIASGPCSGDETTQADARAILAKYAIGIPANAMQVLSDPAFETVKPGDARLSSSLCCVVARASDALAAAVEQARRIGWAANIIDENVEGNARQAARAHAGIALRTPRGTKPLVLLSGGELTLQVAGRGAGGPNREYVLALLHALNGAAHIWALAADTDGIDGNDATAGAWIGPETLSRARQLGLEPQAYADGNDSGGFFGALDQAVVTGPTRTNVNDFRAILIAADV
jgi:glycerate 2-kinase